METRGPVISGRGPLPARFLLVGERPGEQEAREGRVFAGPSGWELNRYLRIAHISLDDCRIENLVRDYIPGNPEPEQWEVERDQDYLRDIVRDCKPEVIIPMGGHSSRYFLPWMRERGWGMEHVEGFEYRFRPGIDLWSPWEAPKWSNSGRVVFPIYHPAAGLHKPDMQYYIRRGWERLRGLLQGKNMYPPDPLTLPPPHYDSYRQLNGDGESFTGVIALDTEFTSKGPWAMSAADNTNCGTAVGPKQWTKTAKRMNGGCYVFHHALVDLPILEKMGFDIPPGSYDDTMLMAYVLQCHPQGLKALSYRLLGREMREYDQVVAPAQNRIAEEWFAEAACACIPSDVLSDKVEELVYDKGEWKKKRGWSAEQRVNRILSDYHNKPNVQLRTRWKKVPPEQQKALESSVSREFPIASLADIPLNEAVDYASADADATRRVYFILKKEIRDSGLEQVYKMDLVCYPIIRKMREGGILIDREYFKRLRTEVEEEAEKVIDTIADVSMRINPMSGDQVAALLFDTLHLKPKGKVRFVKSGRPSTQDKYLESWRTLHPVVGLICDYRELQKLKGTFIDAVLASSARDGYHYPNLQHTRVYTGRYSAKEPNDLALPARGEWGKKFRRGYIARPGNVWGCWDLDGIEARWLAFVSQDENLCNVFRQGIDFHSNTAAGVFKVPYDKVDHETQRRPCKTLNYGVIYGISPQGLHDQLAALQLSYSLADCAELISGWYATYPGVKRYYRGVDAFARRYGYVTDYWGRKRFVEQVRCSIRRIAEEGLRQAENHTIQGGATGVFKLWLANVWYGVKKCPWIRPLLPVHDELNMEMPESSFDSVDPVIRDCADRAAPLDMVNKGVRVIAKGGMGANWAEAKG